MEKTDKNLKEGSLDYRLGNIKSDGIKVVVTSGLLAMLGIARDCSHIVGMANTPGFHNFLMPFDVGAGAFLGYTKKYGASLIVYGATIVPDLVGVAAGNGEYSGKMILAKTLVFGASYGLGWAGKKVMNSWRRS